MRPSQISDAATIPDARWRKSSYSGQGGGQCVEVAHLRSAIAVRDSKQTRGPALLLPTIAFSSLLTLVRSQTR